MVLGRADEVTAWQTRRTRHRRGPTIGVVLYLYGCPVSEQAARNLIATLISDGAADGLAAAGQIDDALHKDRVATGLSPEMRDAVFAALADPPPELTELRDRLGRDVAHRGTGQASEPSSLSRRYRLILIGKDRDRTRLVLALDAQPHVGDHLAVPSAGEVVVHHVSPSQSTGIDGVIIAGSA